MKILFLLYGDFTTNTAIPLNLFARELQKMGHECIFAVPDGIETVGCGESIYFTPFLMDEVLQRKGNIFSDGSRADIIHACTPRINISNFLKEYQALLPTPLVIYLEDNESWISQKFLDLKNDEFLKLTSQELTSRLPTQLSHPLDYPFLISLADLIIVAQEKLKVEVPEYVNSEEVWWGVDQDFFNPLVGKSDELAERLGLGDIDIVIVYHGGLNGFTRGPLIDLCNAIGLVNAQGISCRLIRTGNNKINFWDELDLEASRYIIELGVVEREELPSILALADMYVQPGRIDPFEDLRIPSKALEFFSMGKPVILPNVNIANLLRDWENAVILKSGSPQEIANACISLFRDPIKAKNIGLNGRLFAEESCNILRQAKKLEILYKNVIQTFDKETSRRVWDCMNDNGYFEAALLKASIVSIKYPSKSIQATRQILLWGGQLNQRLNSVSARVIEAASNFLPQIVIADKKSSSLFSKIKMKLINLFLK